MRIGTKGRPFYRIVVVDERKKRTGAYIDLIGTYNPLSTPKEIKIDQEKVEAWTKKGAQMSTGFLRITGKAHQRPEGKVRNPGKLRSSTPAEPKAEVEEAVPEATEDAAVEQEVVTEIEAEAPVEEVAQEVEVSSDETPAEDATPEPEMTEDAPVNEEVETETTTEEKK